MCVCVYARACECVHQYPLTALARFSSFKLNFTRLRTALYAVGYIYL